MSLMKSKKPSKEQPKQSEKLTRKDKKQKKIEKKADKEHKEIEKKVESLAVANLLPYVNCDENTGAIIMDDGTIMDFLEIRSKDIFASGNDDNVMNYILWDRLYKTFSGDLKHISFYFPTETTKQQEYIDSIATRTYNPKYREFLSVAKYKMVEINRTFMDKHFILCFYSKSQSEYENNLIDIKSTLNRMATPIVYDIPFERKIKILYKLFNKNMNM